MRILTVDLIFASGPNWKKLFCNQMLNEDLQPCFQLQPLGQLSWPGRVEKVADSLCISNLCLNVICCHTSHLFDLDFTRPCWIGFDLNSFHCSKTHRQFTLMRYPDPNPTFEKKSWRQGFGSGGRLFKEVDNNVQFK